MAASWLQRGRRLVSGVPWGREFLGAIRAALGVNGGVKRSHWRCCTRRSKRYAEAH